MRDYVSIVLPCMRRAAKAADAPPKSPRKSRRFHTCPQVSGKGIVPGQLGIAEGLTPASLLQHEMLADDRFGSKGEILAKSRCFPLWPQQRTSLNSVGMFVRCHEQTWT